MSSANDFVIENGVLKKYCGPGGDVVIPESVTSIGDEAFSGCSKLTSVTIPVGVTSIGDAAFAFCGNLESVTVPEGVKSIGKQAFCGCSSLKCTSIPEGVTSIGYETFYKCSSLKEVTIPKNVASIGREAFWNCESLKGVTIQEGVTSIGDYAFDRCSSLTQIALPAGVTSVGDCAFRDCKKLKNFTISDKNLTLSTQVFGNELPAGLVKNLRDLYPHLTDNTLKNYVLNKKVWKQLPPELQKEIFTVRQGKTLSPAYIKCVNAEQAETLDSGLLEILRQNPSVKECNTAAAFITMFYRLVRPELLQELYAALKEVKTGAKAVRTIEADVSLMELLGSSVKADESLPAAERMVTQRLIDEKMSVNDLKKKLKDYYGLAFKDLELHSILRKDGSEAASYVLAWLLTAHETVRKNKRKHDKITELYFSEKTQRQIWDDWFYEPPVDITTTYSSPGIRPEAAEIVAELDQDSFQYALLKLADYNFGMTGPGRSKKMYLAFPICRYADEKLMADLCQRALGWWAPAQGDDTPPLLNFRIASAYSTTHAALLFADKNGDLKPYAKIRGVKESVLKNQALPEIEWD